MFTVLPFGYMFMLFMILGTMLSLSSMHWLGIWAGLEINLIGFLPLLIYGKKTSESESAVKYFIIQALGSSLLLFGSLSVFSVFSWEILVPELQGTAGFLLILGGLCIKLGLFPFHYWLPGVMAGLSWLSCLLLATWQKIAPLFLIVSLSEMNIFYTEILVLSLISAGSSLVGGLGGMNQTQIRSMLAYSSIGHLGWMTFALIHSEWCLKSYLLIYVVISICLFCSLGTANVSMIKSITSLRPKSFLIAMLLLLSLGGLPPLLGFIPKWAVILTSFSGPIPGVLFLLILGSLMSLFYYLSLFFSVLLGQKSMLLSEAEGQPLLVLFCVLNLLGGAFLLGNNIFLF